MSRSKAFKTCPSCSKKWFSKEDMLYDPDVSLLGYQVHFVDYSLGLFYFNHKTANCQTTFAIRVADLKDLYNGPVYSEVKMADEDCPLYCLRRTELRHCNQQCAGAYVREIMQIISQIHEEVIQSSVSTIY